MGKHLILLYPSHSALQYVEERETLRVGNNNNAVERKQFECLGVWGR